MKTSRWNTRTESGPLGSGGMRIVTRSMTTGVAIRISVPASSESVTDSLPTPPGVLPGAEIHQLLSLGVERACAIDALAAIDEAASDDHPHSG